MLCESMSVPMRPPALPTTSLKAPQQQHHRIRAN